MDLKRLVTHFAYRIEPKPDGGFIARASDPSVPPLEAPTRQELTQKIQQNILSALSSEFPASKLPPESQNVQMSFHVERTPAGGFEIHSADPNTSVIHADNQQEFESKFLNKFINFAGQHMMAELAKAAAAQGNIGNVTVTVNRRTTFHTKSGAAAVPALDPTAQPGTNPDLNSSLNSAQPITPESSSLKFFLLALGCLALLLFLYLARR